MMACYCIVGLGNPGNQYFNTRHNIGFEILESLAGRLGLIFQKQEKFSCKLASYRLKDSLFYFVLPQTFMNLSGQSVVKVERFYQPSSILVVHDDLDLPLGALRFKKGGGSGGHNGLKSIDEYRGNDYYRIRFGIGRSDSMEVSSYVLSQFDLQELSKKNEGVKHCEEALMFYLETQNFSDMQNRFTKKG